MVPAPRTLSPRGGLVVVNDAGIAQRLDGSPINRLETLVASALRGFMAMHPCIGARSLSKVGSFHLTVLDSPRSVESAVQLLNALTDYYRLSDDEPLLKTLAAVYVGEPVPTQEAFEEVFWQGIQFLHDCDEIPWDPRVGQEPDSVDFELSLAGRAVFTTTLNPGSPRFARRFIYPTFVLNQTAQFDALRCNGDMARWQSSIRRLDMDLQGSPNPILADHGAASAAPQLAGSNFYPCPFVPRRSRREKADAMAAMLQTAGAQAASREVQDDLLNRLRKLEGVEAREGPAMHVAAIASKPAANDEAPERTSTSAPGPGHRSDRCPWAGPID